MSQQKTSLDYNKNAQDLLKLELEAEGQKIKALKHKPTGYEAEANLFKNIRAGFGSKRKPWHQTAAEGLINGLEYGIQSKQVQAKKEDYDKTDKVFNYFKQNIASLEQANEQELQKIKNIEAVRPYATAILNNNFSGMSYEQANANNQDLFQQAQLNNPNIKGYYAGFIPNTPNLLIRGENGEIKPFTLATILPEDALKEAQQTRINQQNANSQEIRANASEMSANTARDRFGFEKDHYDQDFEEKRRRNDIMQQNANQRLEAVGLKNVKEVVPILRSINKGIHLTDEVMADAKKYPDIFRSALSSWINTKGDSGAFSLEIQKMLPGYSDKDKDALMRVTKNLNQLMLTELKGLGGGGNLTVDSWIQQGTLNTQYSVENVQHLLGQVKAELQFSEKLYDKALNHSGGSFISDSYKTHKPMLETELQAIRDKTEGNIVPLTPNQMASLSPEEKLQRLELLKKIKIKGQE